jgi:hypothetical protein
LPIPDLTPGGAIEAGNENARVYSVSATLTPWRRLFFSDTFSYTDSRTATAQNGANYLTPWKGNVYSLLSSATFVLNTNTSFRATYAFSKSAYGQSNPNGLPLGINYDRHALRFGVSQRLARNIVADVSYGFSQYREPTFGGAADFTAHAVFATLTFAWR